VVLDGFLMVNMGLCALMSYLLMFHPWWQARNGLKNGGRQLLERLDPSWSESNNDGFSFTFISLRSLQNAIYLHKLGIEHIHHKFFLGVFDQSLVPLCSSKSKDPNLPVSKVML
jgi:hypothetical protein